MAPGGSRHSDPTSRVAKPARGVFADSLARARTILRSLPLWGLALILSAIYLASRTIRVLGVARAGLALALVVVGATGLAVLTRSPTPERPPVVETRAPPPRHEPSMPDRGHDHPAPNPGEAANHHEASDSEAPESETEERAKAAAEGVSLTVTVAEAVAHQLGESLSFFEFGGKIGEIFTPLKTGDTDTAVSKSAGAVTEYGVAALLVDGFEVMAMIASGVLVETAVGLAGSMAIVRAAVTVGEKVEEAAHHSLKGAAAP